MSDNLGKYYQTITACNTTSSGNCTWTSTCGMPYQNYGIGNYTWITTENVNKIEGVEIMKLYDVYLVYAETRLAPFFMRKDNIIAKDPEDAKIKSGLMKEVLSHWDSDYLTFITKEIGEVKVKEKPKEVKNING